MLCLLLLAWCDLGCLPGHAASLQSPNGQIQLEFDVEQQGDKSQLKYNIAFAGQPVLQGAEIAFRGEDGSAIGQHVQLQNVSEVKSHDSTWNPVYGERSTVRDHYNSIRTQLTDKATGHVMRIEFRCYDAGVAYQATLQAPAADEPIRISAEASKFRFTGDHIAWCATRAQDSYRQRRLSQISGRVERPLTIELNDSCYAAIAEAGLVDYATMQLRRDQQDPHCVVSQLGGGVQSHGKLQTPWRVVMLGASVGELLENNDLILNLNAPCAIEDTSWIKPGKVIREITLTTAGAKACIDFAHEHNFQFVEFDAGWYGHEYSDDSDATTVSLDEKRSSGPLDLHWVIDYAKQRDIGIIVYVNRRALERQLDEILPLYKKWGIAGVKYGFVQTESQRWTRWLHEAVKKAAAHQLMVDVHDEYRPTGFSRTYPNLMTQEGVRGDEATPSSSQAITTLFTRNLAGAADHTICYFDSRVTAKWSHGHQLAKAVCTYSPWQFMYWYDTPLAAEADGMPSRSRIVDSPELEFFAQVPTVWDETRVIRGEIGKYAVIARRSGQDWFVGAMNSGTERELEVPLDFLTDSTSYKARVYSDDPKLDTPTRVRIDEQLVDSDAELTIDLQPNGGQAMWLRPVDSSDVAAHPPSAQPSR
ncbi:glycoside hydrolase family 97 protein [Aeoliella sp. ICT_H6.2]|uniref:Glycoside hydrolase family 97 protein n=1 Tax=Aeoliella straminimaris TaxID=2954799 RepID=A0A9X2JJ36_9BACT|nr:glycoside hydrolase family 97 protein [Aeoliella straminimaris]MCO6047456.1 glycoside hydrolase family 97 protein [Aeoliella straminimaris]